jgi:hypothetical protein
MSVRAVAHGVVDVFFVCAAAVWVAGLVIDGVHAHTIVGVVGKLVVATVLAFVVGRVVLGHLGSAHHGRSTPS